LTTKIIGILISTLIAISAIVALPVLVWSAHDSFAKVSYFPEYYASAKLILAGKGASSYLSSNLGQMQHELFPAMGKRFVPMYLPPQGLILLTPIALLQPVPALYVWKAFLIACLVFSVIFLVRTFSLDYKKTCFLIAGLCLSYACYEALRIDQIAPILLLSLSAALYFLQKNRDIKAGLALSIMIIKPQYILPFLVYLVGMRRWRPIIIFCGISLILTVAAYLLIGWAGFANYFALLLAPQGIFHMQPALMPTFFGQMLRLSPFFSKEILYIANAVFLAVAFCSWFCGSDNRDNAKAILWAYLITIPVTLLTSLHCCNYDLLLLVPALIIIFTDAVLPIAKVFKLLVVVLGLVFMVPLAIWIHDYYLLKGGLLNIWFIELLLLEFIIIMRLSFTKESQ
jgi:hypothetical protein